MEALLKVNDISMVFGGLRAVSNFSMEIKAGELIGLIGPNGAGKTTAFNMITGVYTPTEGEIMFNGTRTSGKKSYQVTQLGMARTFQNIRLFSELSVIDNVNLDYKYYSLVSLMAMLSMVIVLLLTSLSIAREKEVGTFDQLIVSPLSSTEILIGKAVPAQLLAWLLTMVMLAISVHFFDFPLVGSLAVFLAADFVALLALVGVGLFISSLCRTQQQAILGVFTFQMPAVLLSGFISPIDNMPVILQYLTYLNPLRFFLVIAKGVLLKNMDMYHVLINLTPLALIAVLTLSIAGWTFKSKLE